MASIIQIKNRWRAQIRRKGQSSITKTFSTEAEAQAWASQIETELGSGFSAALDVPLGLLVQRYIRHDPDMGDCKRDALKQLKAGLGHIFISQLSVSDVARYVEGRGYGPATAQVEISALNMLLKMARVMWRYSVPDIMDDVKDYLRFKGCYKKSKERDRRPTEDELQRLGKWFDENSRLPMKDLMWFSIHSAMRASEVTRIRWEDYDPVAKTVIIRDRKDPRRKIGNDQEVPLLDVAVEIIERQPRVSDRIFPYNPPTFSTLLPRARRALGIEDLRWHDLRHEGTSRLFEMGYQIQEVPAFTGHRDWHQLKRYTHLRAKTLRRLTSPVQSSSKELSILALLPPVTNKDPHEMKSAEIEQEIKIIQARTALLKKLYEELGQVDMHDIDRCILLQSTYNERNGLGQVR